MVCLNALKVEVHILCFSLDFIHLYVGYYVLLMNTACFTSIPHYVVHLLKLPWPVITFYQQLSGIKSTVIGNQFVVITKYPQEN